eukprot:TRINITY_DN2738_c0_g2_i1.p1 TRINITY_DN2738_c0_g2~~TRINITY_DN2738_c0_g2_i1.p1  ORF type:complete len:1458 (-),score=308.92 TRINITY_DN2738_c0_g2_i1:110-4483(-)
MESKDALNGQDPFKRSSYFWEKKANQMLNLIYGPEKSSGQKRSSASAAASTSSAPSSPAPSSGGSASQNGFSDTPSRTTSSPGVSKRKSSNLSQETVQTAISAAALDRVDSARSSSPTSSKTSAKSFRFSLPQNAGDLMGAPTPEKPERSPRNRAGYESDSRAQRKRSNSQLTALVPNSVVSPASSPKSKKRSSSVSSNPPVIVSESKQKSVPDLKASGSRSGSKSALTSSGVIPKEPNSSHSRAGSGSSANGDTVTVSVSADVVVSLQQTIKNLTDQVASLQTSLADERVEREQMRAKILDQERAISTLADAVQRQVGLLEHFRAEVDSLRKSNLSSSQNGTLATSTSEDASMIQSRGSLNAGSSAQPIADSAEEDSLTRKKSTRGSRTVISSPAPDAAVIFFFQAEDGIRDRSHSSPRKAERKSSKREKRETPSRADSGFESDSTPARVRRRSVTSGASSRTAAVNRAEGASIMEPPSSDSKAVMVRSRSQTLHERSSASADSTAMKKDSEVHVRRQSSVRDKDKDRDSSKRRMESKSADSVPRQSSKITVRSPKSKSSAKLVLSPSDLGETPASPSTTAAGDGEVGGDQLTRRSSKPKVRRPASTTFGADVLRRSSDKDILGGQTSPVTSPKPRPSTSKSKSSRANKLLEQLTPAEQAETAAGGLAVTQTDVSPRHEGLLSRSASSSSELGPKSPSSRPQQARTSSSDRIMSPESTSSRRNSSKDIVIMSPKLETQNSQDKLATAVSDPNNGDDDDDDLHPSKQSYGESDASSGADDNKTKQIIRKVNIFAAGGARVFGVPLAQCQLDERATVPVVLASLANTLKAEKPAPGDLFERRVDPAKIEALKKRLESTRESITLKETDIYVVAATLKRFFTDLPEPLLTAHMRKQWLQVADIDDDVVRVPAIRSLFHALERVNRKVLEYMVIFFNRLVDNSNSQLTLKQIATAFGPAFLRPIASNISTPVSAGPHGASSSSSTLPRPEVKREASSIGADAPSGDFADFTPEMLEEKSVTLLAVFMRQYPNIFLLKCPGIEYHKRTFHVRAATVDNFVGLMLDSNYIEREFHEIFWITYPYFIDSDDLLMRFTDLYHEYNANSRWESRYRMKILFVVKLWVRRLGVALQHDESFKDDLNRFITEALRMVENSTEDTLEKPMLLSLQSMQFASAADAEGRSIIDRIMAGAGAGALAGAPQLPPSRMQRSPSGKKLLSLKGAPLDVLQLDGKSLAFQITLIDYKLVHMITPNELINGNSMDPHKSPNYTAMVRYINRITHWVAFEILSRPTPADRARVLAYFIDVAYYCRKMCNFNGSWAVFGAFGLHPVSRMSQTWERLPRREATRHKKLSALFEPRLNFSEYRKQMDRAIHEGSCVPILAFLPKDIIRFETDPTFTEDRLVDFDKMRGIFQTLQLLSHCQNDPGVPAGKVEDLWELLLGLPDIEGDDLDALSYKAEPKK